MRPLAAAWYLKHACTPATPLSPEPTGDAPDPTDHERYFITYSYLYHQKEMLEDHKRTGAYYQAVMQNKRKFAGKVVLDVGTGACLNGASDA
jgi:hypothetical protein